MVDLQLAFKKSDIDEVCLIIEGRSMIPYESDRTFISMFVNIFNGFA